MSGRRGMGRGRTRGRLAPFAAAILAANACSGPAGEANEPAPEPRAADESLEAALSGISREHLEAHLAYLAADEREGRMTGTKGYDDSAAYVAGRFEAIGLVPAGEEGWYQHVPLLSKRIDPAAAAVTLHHDGADEELRWKDDYVMGGDDMRAETSVRAEVVYAGFGVHAPELGYSDYEGIDVEGRIVAVFGGAPASFPHNERAWYSSGRTKAEEMAARGAVGWIGLRSRTGQKRVPWERLVLNAGMRPGMSWLNRSGEAQDYHPQIEGRAVLDAKSAAALFAGSPLTFEQALDAADDGRPMSMPLGVEATLERRTAHEKLTSPNVVGMLRGSDPELRDEYVVYSAHLDHLGTGAAVDGDDIYNGYYDNAMGIALMLETARAYARLDRAPRRSVLFLAVTAEERGLLGSDYFAHYPTVPPDAIVANINLDMPLLMFPLADVVAFGAGHSTLGSRVASAVEAEGLVLTPDPMPEEVIFIRSDQYSFVRQGVPSVFLVPGFASTDPAIDGEALIREHLATHYHRPSDDSSRPVNWDSALRFARANARAGLAVANDDRRPAWHEGDFFGERYGRGRERTDATEP